jgi:hypothetical protein
MVPASARIARKRATGFQESKLNMAHLIESEIGLLSIGMPYV